MPEFIGRVRERHAVDSAWDAAIAGRRQVVFIGGPPGAGKSRLAAEAATAAHHRGALVLHGRCFADHTTPFQPFVEAFGGVIGTIEGSDGEGFDLVRRFLGGEEAPDSSSATRVNLFDAVVDVVAALARERAAMLVIDDVHWASQPSMELLAHVARSRAPRRLVVIATFRSTLPDRSPMLVRTISDLYRLPGVRRIDLEGLSVDEIAEFLARRTGQDADAMLQSATLLRDHTGGNPFFLNEVWSGIVASGGFAALAAGRLTIPPSVGDALHGRISALPGATTDALEVAALCSVDIDIDTVVAASRSSRGVALAALDAAVEAGLLMVRESGYAFVHELARQAIVDQIRPSRLQELHAQIARALEARLGDRADTAALIGHHEAAAGVLGDPAKAVTYLERAGRFAAMRLAFEEAAEHLERAAGLERSGDARERLLLAAAANHVKGGSFREAQRLYAGLCESNNPRTMALAAVGFEDAGWRPGYDGGDATAKLAAADHVLDAEAHPALHIQLRASLSRALEYSGRHIEAQEVGDQVLAEARQFGDERLVAVALHFPVTYVPEVREEDMARLDEAARLAKKLNDDGLLTQVSFTRGSTAYTLGLPGKWESATRDLLTTLNRSGQPLDRAGTGMSIASSRFISGDFEGAMQSLDGVIGLGDAFDSERLDGLHSAATFMIRRETGLEAVRPLITGDPSTEVGTWRLGLLALYTELGMVEAAGALLDDLAHSPYMTLVAAKYQGSVTAFLSEAVAFVRRADLAKAMYEKLLPRSGTNLLSGHFVSVFGSADRYLGLLAATAGLDAEDHFEKALVMDEKMGDVVHRAESLARYAVYLRGRDSRRAAALAGEAMKIAERIGSVRVENLVKPVGDVPHEWLTSREIEVLRLVATGMSNKEISDTLFISRNTVANHVRSILMKTASTNRTQASRYAADNGLLS